MNIRTYDDIEVEILNGPNSPGKLSQQAMRLTMTKEIARELGRIKKKPLDFLISAGHGSVIEHETFTFALEGVSRSFLAQITRHRIGSFTSASQHYADYSDMPMVIHPNASGQERAVMKNSFFSALIDYRTLCNLGYPKEEARQVLPNAAATNIIWTVNARSLANFMHQRLCKRNVHEAQIVALKILTLLEEYWLEFAEVVGPACYTHGKCDQGKMSCGSFWTPTYYPTVLKRTK